MNHVDFAAIVEKHAEGLLGRALQLTGEYDQAWDLVQDTWERALSRYPENLPEDRVWSWLAIVLRNRFLDQLRRCDSRRTMRLTEEQWLGLPGPEPEEGEDWRAFTEEDIRASLYDLPEPVRAPFALHALEGMRYDQVAQRLGVPPGTVGTRILRAKRMLRGHLLAADGPSARPSPRRASASRRAGASFEPRASNAALAA